MEDTNVFSVSTTFIAHMYMCTYVSSFSCCVLFLAVCSEAAVESDLQYMLQPSRIYIGDNINTFNRGATFKPCIMHNLCIWCGID